MSNNNNNNNKNKETMKASNKRIEVALNKFVKETEKAICVNVMVSWNSNCCDKDIWMPKSVCEVFTAEYDNNKTHAMVDEWFLHKTEAANAFHGYGMRFETAFWN